MKVDPRIEAAMRRRIREDCICSGYDPDEKICGLTCEEMVLGGAAFQRWLYTLQAAMWSRLGVKEGDLAAPLSEGIPEELDSDREAVCRTRAEQLYLLDLLPKAALRELTDVYVKLLFGPVKTASGSRPIEDVEIRRIIWLKVVMTDGEAKFSEEFKELLRALWTAIWPDFDGAMTHENILAWYSHLVEEQETSADSVVAFLKRAFRFS